MKFVIAFSVSASIFPFAVARSMPLMSPSTMYSAASEWRSINFNCPSSNAEVSTFSSCPFNKANAIVLRSVPLIFMGFTIFRYCSSPPAALIPAACLLRKEIAKVLTNSLEIRFCGLFFAYSVRFGIVWVFPFTSVKLILVSPVSSMNTFPVKVLSTLLPSVVLRVISTCRMGFG